MQQWSSRRAVCQAGGDCGERFPGFAAGIPGRWNGKHSNYDFNQRNFRIVERCGGAGKGMPGYVGWL